MADPRQAVVFRWLAAGDAGHFDAFDDLLHPDAVIHAPSACPPAAQRRRRRYGGTLSPAMPDLCHEVQEVLVDGDVEMARVVITGTIRTSFAAVESTGRSFRIDQAVITHLRDGKVVEAWEIADVAALQPQVPER